MRETLFERGIGDPLSEYTPLTSPSFRSVRLGLPQTVSGSVGLNVEKMTPFVNIFDVCFPSFGIFGIDIVERRLNLYDGSSCGIAHCT